MPGRPIKFHDEQGEHRPPHGQGVFIAFVVTMLVLVGIAAALLVG